MNIVDDYINFECFCNKCEFVFFFLLDWYLCFIEKDIYLRFCKVFLNDMKNFYILKKGFVKKLKNNKRKG